MGRKIQVFLLLCSLIAFIGKFGKSKVLSFLTHSSRHTRPFELIRSDMWSMALVISSAKYKYFATFIDDFSGFTCIYFLQSKGEVFSVFKLFHAHLETQFSARIKILRSDNGGEYMSQKF